MPNFKLKFCRFQPLVVDDASVTRHVDVHPSASYGVIAGESVLELDGDYFSEPRKTGRGFPIAQVKLLPPVTPSKIVCVGRNYSEHAAELGNEVPKEPLIFLKPPSSIIAHEEPIVMPPISKRVDHEGELAIIIGRRCSRARDAAEAAAHIFGYTCLNDVTARDLQKTDPQFTRPKGFDTFCPFGPVIETDLDFATATLSTLVNGQRRQHAPLAQMIFSCGVIIAWISQVMTLEPGDLIATGTPAGVGPLAAGDVVEVTITGIGTLRNAVIAQQ